MDLYGQAANHTEQPFTVDEDKLWTHVIVRKELEMTPGKLASQVGHAARMSLLKYLDQIGDPSLIQAAIQEFLRLGTCGSIAVLQAHENRQTERIETAEQGAREAGIPTARFVDSQHVMLPHFDGSPVFTAAAIGPALKETNRPFTKRFQCVK